MTSIVYYGSPRQAQLEANARGLDLRPAEPASGDEALHLFAHAGVLEKLSRAMCTNDRLMSIADTSRPRFASSIAR